MYSGFRVMVYFSPSLHFKFRASPSYPDVAPSRATCLCRPASAARWKNTAVAAACGPSPRPPSATRDDSTAGRLNSFIFTTSGRHSFDRRLSIYLSVCLSACLSINRITQKVKGRFSWHWAIGRLGTREEFIKF